MADILIVDDDPLNRLLLNTILESRDYSIVEASDGKQALAAIEDGPPRMIIMDLNMPGMDGFDFLRLLRSDSRNADIAIVIHTATSTDSALQELLRLYEVADVLPKPFDPQELLRLVADRLGG